MVRCNHLHRNYVNINNIKHLNGSTAIFSQLRWKNLLKTIKIYLMIAIPHEMFGRMPWGMTIVVSNFMDFVLKYYLHFIFSLSLNFMENFWNSIVNRHRLASWYKKKDFNKWFFNRNFRFDSTKKKVWHLATINL